MGYAAYRRPAVSDDGSLAALTADFDINFVGSVAKTLILAQISSPIVPPGGDVLGDVGGSTGGDLTVLIRTTEGGCSGISSPAVVLAAAQVVEVALGLVLVVEVVGPWTPGKVASSPSPGTRHSRSPRSERALRVSGLQCAHCCDAPHDPDGAGAGTERLE